MDYHKSILHLRILVLTLGESHHFGWWKSQFLSPTGISFLERVYPKTNFATAIQSATQVAKAIHDQAIGKGDVNHLFRLSPPLERDISQKLLENSQQLENQYSDILHDQDGLLRTLEEITGDSVAEPSIGPVQISVLAGDLVQTMATYYLVAFQQEKQIYPYFEEVLTS